MGGRGRAWESFQAEWSFLHETLPSRIAPYDALLARRDSLTPAADAYEAAKLVREHARRVAYWRERLGAEQAADLLLTGLRTRQSPNRRVEMIMVLGGSAGAVGLIALAWRSSWPFAVLAALGLGGTVAALALATRSSERPRLGDALERALCPDCGYDLAGLPPALPVDVLGRLDVGPAACPECGSAWPRVPPPAPAPKPTREPVEEIESASGREDGARGS